MEGLMIPWSEFTRLVDRNLLPWRQVKYYPGEKKFQEERVFSIYDFSLPRRKGTVVAWGKAEKEWERDSFVCNVTAFDNYMHVDDTTVQGRPARGVRSALKALISDGVIRKSEEVEQWLRTR